MSATIVIELLEDLIINKKIFLILLYFQFCTFNHAGKMCEIFWTKQTWNVTMGECSDYSGKATFTVSKTINSQNNVKVIKN